MRVQFIQHENGPARLICDAEIILSEELENMKLVGFSLWRSADGETYVTFPSRSFGVSTERRYFDYLRSTEGLSADVKRVKDWILAEHRAHEAAAHGRPATEARASVR
jgi:hypothetical protein